MIFDIIASSIEENLFLYTIKLGLLLAIAHPEQYYHELNDLEVRVRGLR